MLLGTYTPKLDDKGRVILPAKFRTDLGDGVVVTVRLIDKRSGKPVPDAVIFAKRIDMEPEGMAAMASPIEAAPAPAMGSYSFRTNLTMEGGWRLSLGAKIQGETGTLDSKLILKALP